ncbi:cytochrome b/b6 domain-containing protein [Loktanella sp. TSTF-M6]|uniref:Cytochrome b/b6 domain-containing protein n=1 Tax=Loktanella gaetbuli TaxID=2881335 RepID=A0ABS8BQ32_9RHOB|nr:cytochrome b/b6 domain-containing protein [Loktanella gaetbuli]MCB5197828.1 cytochrome b/b6 domain-containing protein [Loktanella gaetbuli]
MSDTPTTYGTVTKTFHWLTAILILALLILGTLANDWAADTDSALAIKTTLFSTHKTLGVLLFFVALLRIIWAIGHRKPGPLHPERKTETLLAEIVHWTLYGSLVLVPLTGWIDHAASTGFAPIWWPFGQSLPFVPKNPEVAHLFGSVHIILTKVLIGALALHVAGALKHHFIDKDATLRRMWFGKSQMPDVAYHRTPIAAPALAATVLAIGAGVGAGMAAGTTAAPTTEALAEVASDWTVQDGALGITVVQMGDEVTGSFADWTAAITFDPDATADAGTVEVTVSIGSLTLGSVTDQAMGADFFNQANFPTATFAAPITVQDDGSYVADGTLTLKGVEAPVTLPFSLTLEGDTATASGQTTLNRQTFNIGESMEGESNLAFDVIVTMDLTATRNN